MYILIITGFIMEEELWPLTCTAYFDVSNTNLWISLTLCKRTCVSPSQLLAAEKEPPLKNSRMARYHGDMVAVRYY